MTFNSIKKLEMKKIYKVLSFIYVNLKKKNSLYPFKIL